MKKIFLFIVFTSITNISLASDHRDHHERPKVEKVTKTSKQKLLVKVNGMVCSFCAQGIEKNFKKREEVKSVKVDLDEMKVHLSLKEGKSISEEEIKKTVEGAGFKFVSMKNE